MSPEAGNIARGLSESDMTICSPEAGSIARGLSESDMTICSPVAGNIARGLSENDMTICSPEAGNIARGQYYLSRVNKSSCHLHSRATTVLLYRYLRSF